MTDPRTRPDDRPNVAHEPLEDEIAELQGEEPFVDQDGTVDAVEIEGDREPTISEQEWGVPVDPQLRSGETDDPLVAIEEGQTWVPPSDPPIVPAPDDPEGVAIPGSIDDDLAEGSLNRQVREALRADGATSTLADQLEIAVVGSTAIFRGRVDGIEDGDAIVAVASQVDGIDDVRDETEIAGLS